jgi:transposase
MKTYRPYTPRQSYLLPPSPQDWLPEGHLAYFILDLVTQLDLSRIYAYYEREERGFPPHHPLMMMALLLYGYCVGVPSSRKIERKTHEDVAFRVIAGDQHPDHTCVSEFRRIHQAVFADVFVQVLKICQEAGLVKLGHVALDGTKMKASASKHKAMSYERMKEQEAELAKKVEDLLRAADEADAAEDARFGKDKRGDELPEDLQRAESRIARIRAAKAALEAEAKAQLEAEKEEKENRDNDDPPAGGATPLPQHRIPRDAEGDPTPKAQRNFTDAESRIQKTVDGFIQGYSCQAAVDEGHQIIVAQAVTNQPPDVEHLTPMLEQVVTNCGDAPEKFTADAGYFSEQNVAKATVLGTDPFIAPGRWKRGEKPTEVLGILPMNMTPKQAMARKLATPTGAAAYARRKAVVEPVFGQIKQARGLRQFLMRGLVKVRAEWSLITLTHNLLKLHAAAP